MTEVDGDSSTSSELDTRRASERLIALLAAGTPLGMQTADWLGFKADIDVASIVGMLADPSSLTVDRASELLTVACSRQLADVIDGLTNRAK